MKSQTRREFFKKASLLVVALPLLSVFSGSWDALAKPKDKKAVPLPEGQVAVPETDAVASAIGFHHNVKDIDFTRYPQRKKPDAKNQFCHNCALFTAVNESWGKCQMLTSGLVSAEGWCGSYSKKA